MTFKRIYIEITNICNLNCSFCPPHNRKNEYMTFENFKNVLSKIKPYTSYIYLHVKGEPMLHPEFDKFVEYAKHEGFEINITTNGTLLKKHLQTMKYIRQLNISLHATNDDAIIKDAKEINDCIVNFRIWNKKDASTNIENISNMLELQINKEKITNCFKDSLPTNFSLGKNFFISLQNEFDWPDINSNDSFNTGYCHATKDHIAILVDGTVVPCCLDNNGEINLGNIFNEDLEDILHSKRFLAIKQGFQNRVCVENLCKKCSYKNRF